MTKLVFRIYTDQGECLAAVAYAEDASFIVPPDGTIRYRNKIVWREGDDRDGEASQSADHVRDVIWQRLGWERR